MIRTLSDRLLRLLAVLVTVLTVAVSLFAWRIASGPLSLDWLTPYLADALSAEDGRVKVAVGATELRLSDDVDLVELVVVDVRATGPDGELLADLPELEVGLSLRALLRGMIAVARLEATAPRLVLLHREDGSIGLRGTEAGPETGQIDLRLLVGRLFGPPGSSDRSSYFERLEILGGRLTLVDQRTGHRLEAQDAELTVTREIESLVGNLAFALRQSGRPAQVHLAGRYDRATEWLGLELDVDRLMPADLANLAPDLPLGGIDLPITGRLLGAVRLDGERKPVRFELAGGPGRVDLPDLLMAPLPIAAVRAEGELAGSFESAVVQRFELTSKGARLAGTGTLSWPDGEIGVDAEIEARNVKARDLALFWPPEAGDEPRAWVVGNITDGVVPQARATIAIRPGDLAQRPPPEGIVDGSFEFDDLTVHYFEELPPLTGVEGSATFTARRMDFAVRAGRIGDIVADGGSVVITGMGIPGRDTTQLEVDVKAAGPLRDVLTVIDYPPLNFVSEAGLSPGDASGSVTAELGIGLPLHRGEIEDSEVRVAVTAELSDAALRTPSFALARAKMTLTADNAGFDLAGKGVVEQIPLAIAFRENFDDDAPFARRYRVQGLVDDGTVARLGGDLPLDLEGAFGLDATIVEARGVREADVALDLLPVAIEAPALDWRKAAGEPGSLSASLVLRDGAPIRVQALDVTAPGLEVSGSLQLQAEPLALESVMIERLVVGRTEGVLALQRGADQVYEVNLDAQSLDLGPLLDTDDAAPDQPPDPLRLEVRAQRALLNGKALSELSADLTRDAQGWRSVWISALLPGGGSLEATLAPEVAAPSGAATLPEGAAPPEAAAADVAGRSRLHVTSNDAGDLLATIDQTSQIVGGALDLDAYVSQQHPTLALDGELRVTDFTVLQAPLLARLLTVASLTGIGNLLSGKGIYFDRFEVPFGYRREVFSVDRVRLSGSQLGLTAKGTLDTAQDRIDLSGTIVPIYGLNWAIGKIPILGDFLRGTEGEGAFAMTYSVTGAADQPRILVNPLAVLAPGMIRELFSGILEGTTKPPKMPQDVD